MIESISDKALAAGHAEATNEAWLVLLTIAHPTLSQPIRLVNNNEDITSRNHVYTALSFEVELPNADPDSPPKARLRIDNVSREIIKTIREIQSPPTITLEVILASQPNTVEVTYTDMTLRNVDYDVASVSGDLSFESIFTEPITYTMTPSRFPGLF